MSFGLADDKLSSTDLEHGHIREKKHGSFPSLSKGKNHRTV